MMQQYLEAKNSHPGMMLLFRMGDFYELFNEDAQEASRILGLTLTSRDKSVPMAGFPHHSLENHLRKLLQAGKRVAVCDQVEEASEAKGLVRREVTRIITPGTLTEDDLLDPRSNNHLVCVLQGAKNSLCGLAWVELSTGQFFAVDLSPSDLRDYLSRLRPAEILFPDDPKNPEPPFDLVALLPGAAFSPRADWCFESGSALGVLHKHFDVSTLSGFGFEDKQICLRAAGALLGYLHETLKAALVHLRKITPFSQGSFLAIDEVTRRSLELTRTMRDGGREGSLLHRIDRTSTPMGARLLSDWLLSPLANINLINQRLDAVDIFKRDYGLRADLRNVLSKAYDLQRLSARIGTGRAGPRDLGSVARTLVLLPEIQAVLARGNSSLLQALSQKIALLPHLRDKLFAALEEQLPLSAKEGGIIKQGYDFDLDELRNISISGKEWMANFQAQEIARTGISSLKVGFNQVFGYFIEITHTHTAKVPPDYQRKQTLKNAERYITPELKEQEEKVLNAQEKLEKYEYELFLQLRELASSHTLELMATAETLAIADVLCSLAELASERGWTRPDIVEKPILDIVDGKHPVLEQTMPSGTFVPNSASLHPEHGMFLLITGPNMGGKSVYIRQVALITLLAHVGSFVPASRVIVGLTDRIFTRVGASDELGRSQSTFMVEMTEAANILNNATASSLVILDEIGRGTSTYDGVSIAWAITEHLHDKVGCRTLFATHYHELAQLEESLKKFKNLRVCVRETPTGIIFLHRIEAGSADQSYGIHVAQRAGVPRPVLDRAKIILADLEERHLLSNEQEGALIRRPKIIQGSLFASTEDPILASLRELDVAKFSSDQLLDLIIRWQKDLRKG